MKEISYLTSKYPVRSNFAEGHNRYWKRLAEPGYWFTGKQRVDMAREVRNARSCELCRQRNKALSPNAVQGAHDRVTDLPEPIVEVIHRVITDNQRLSQGWFRRIIDSGISREQYIEILGTVVHVFMIDEFCRAIGQPLNELPEPVAGDPSRYRPTGLIDVGAWVDVLPDEIDPGAPEADLAGRLCYNVYRGLSLAPDEVRTLFDLIAIHYLSDDDIKDFRKGFEGALDRYQKEVVATRVSSFNDCYYCTSGHAMMLTTSLHQTGVADVDFSGLTDLACKEIAGIPHSGALIAFCDAFMAEDGFTLDDARENLVAEMSEEAMVDAAGIMSNFQRMNRIADGTGLPLEPIGHEKADSVRRDMNERMGINNYRSSVNTLETT